MQKTLYSALLIPFAFLLNSTACFSQQHFFWVDNFVDRCYRVNLDGTGSTEVTPSNFSGAFTGIAIDPATQTLYFSIRSAFGEGTSQFAKMPPGATAMTTLFTQGVNRPGDFAIDYANQRIIWIETGNPGYGIRSAKLDGSQLDTLVPLTGAPRSLAVDFAGGKIYWTKQNFPHIFAANLDGSNEVELYTPENLSERATDLEFNPKDQKVYFGVYGQNSSTPSKIRRIAADGSNPEVVYDFGTNAIEPYGIALDTMNSQVYWCYEAFSDGDFKNFIHRCNLDGSGFEALYDANVAVGSVNVGTIEDIAFDYKKTSSVKNLSEQNAHFSLAPNPSKDAVFIEVELSVNTADLLVTTFDVMGKSVAISKLVAVQNTVEWRHNLPDGAYWIEITTAGGQLVGRRKLLVQH